MSTRQAARTGGGIASATRHTLSNGLVALILQDTSSPTVSLRGEVRVGAVSETAEQSGLAAFTASALSRGTTTRSFQQIIAETEEQGCNVNSHGGMHSIGFFGKALSEDLAHILDILADILINPSFPENEIENLRMLWLMNLREQEEETQYQAARAVNAMLYPLEHPYSRLHNGTFETIQALTRDDMVATQARYHPAITTLAVVGDVEPSAVIEDLERSFGSWNPSHTPPVAELPDVPRLSGLQRQNIAMEGKVQSDILWCTHGLKRTSDDYYPALVGNIILGQLGMGGRLGRNVRENQGLAYHAYSALQAGLEAGPWMAGAGVNPAHVEQAIEAMVHEIEQFKQDGPDDEELSDAQAYLTGSQVLSLETNNGLAAKLLYIEYFNLGLDYIDRFPETISGVSRDDVVRVARQYLSTEHAVLAVAGPGLG